MNSKTFLVLLFFASLLFARFISAADKIDINTASLEQLDLITGIGPALAQRITDARPFSSVDDLLRVKGIGEKTLQKIKDQGLACVNCESIEEVGPPIIPPVVYPEGVTISDAMASPEGPDEENEWIKLFNANSFDVDLTGWKIEDEIGTKTTFIFKEGSKISANNYLVLTRPETKITLNNSGDALNLIRPDGKIVDSFNCTAKTKTNSLAAPTAIKEAVLPSAKALSNDEKSDMSNKVAEANPWFLFLVAIIITVASATFVLFIKPKLKKHVRT